MYIQGDFNTGAAGVFLQSELKPADWFFITGNLKAGYNYQGQNLGFAQSAFAGLLLQFGWSDRNFQMGLETGIDQTLFLRIKYSDFAVSTFSDIHEGYDSSDYSYTEFFPASRFRLGLILRNLPPRGLGFSVSGGALFAPSPLVSSFEGMMFGRFPFYADLGVQFSF